MGPALPLSDPSETSLLELVLDIQSKAYVASENKSHLQPLIKNQKAWHPLQHCLYKKDKTIM